MKLWHVPVRLATGAYVLDQGISKLGGDEQTATYLQEKGSAAVPQIAQIEPMQFLKLLSAGEIAVGTALLLPVIPAWLAGAGLAAFSGGLMRMYLKTPSLRRQGSLRPSQEGGGIAKDSWMLAIGLALVIDALTSRRNSN